LIVRINESNFAWLGANIAVDDTGSLIPGTIDGCSFVTKDGLRIGLFGVCTPSTPALYAISFISRFYLFFFLKVPSKIHLLDLTLLKRRFLAIRWRLVCEPFRNYAKRMKSI
jgi:hypothetical protein